MEFIFLLLLFTSLITLSRSDPSQITPICSNPAFNEIVISCPNTDLSKYGQLLNYPSFTNQTIYLFTPSSKASCPQKTVFFLNPLNNDDYLIQRLNGTIFNITDLDYSIVRNNGKVHDNIINALKVNKVTIETSPGSANIITYAGLKQKTFTQVIKQINKYQRFGNGPLERELFKKSNENGIYQRLHKKFPDEVNYMPESYAIPKQKKEFIKRLGKNYKPTFDNLWLGKPDYGIRSNGVFFLKSIKNIKNNCVVTKYVHNPHLLNKRVYSLRLHVVVTGFGPLKIYLYKVPLFVVAGKDFEIDINNLNDLTPFSSNFNTSLRYEDIKKNKIPNLNAMWNGTNYNDYLLNEGVDPTLIWSRYKDVVIKSVMQFSDRMIEMINSLKLPSSNNGYKIFGIDITLKDDYTPVGFEYNENPQLNTRSVIPDGMVKRGVVTDTLNGIGVVPYNHVTGRPIENDCKYRDKVEQAIEESGNEFLRHRGELEGLFPLKENIEKYRKFGSNPLEENEEGWKRIKDMK